MGHDGLPVVMHETPAEGEIEVIEMQEEEERICLKFPLILFLSPLSFIICEARFFQCPLTILTL